LQRRGANVAVTDGRSHPSQTDKESAVNITRTLGAALAIAAIAAPAAQSQPGAHPHQRVGAYTPGSIPAVSYPSGTVAEPEPPVPGPPTWPVTPKRVTAAAAVKSSDRGNSIDAAMIALGLVAVCGLGAAVQHRRTRRVGVAA
jgi:hypothetical protein